MIVSPMTTSLTPSAREAHRGGDQRIRPRHQQRQAAGHQQQLHRRAAVPAAGLARLQLGGVFVRCRRIRKARLHDQEDGKGRHRPREQQAVEAADAAVQRQHQQQRIHRGALAWRVRVRV